MSDNPCGIITTGTGNFPDFWPAKRVTSGPGLSASAAAKTRNLIALSSSSVSTHISNGEIDKANSMLGRTFRISGKVESGDKLGRTIGIPTANLAVSKDLIIPGDGIYAVKVHVNNQIYKGALSIGNRPVIKADDSRKIEVYIIDFNKNIYGELIEISIISKIRNQENYGSLEELRFQIDKDIVQITNILENA